MGKRIVAVLLCVLIVCGAFAVSVYAEEPDYTALETAATVDDSIPARSVILVEQETGQVLFEKNADEQLPPASITKVMTLLLVMEAIERGELSLDTMVTCSEHANSMGGTQIWFEVGEQLSVDDLIKAAAISSANDASVALAEQVAGSEEAFVELMNKRAKELGMTGTQFMNASGLDAQGHLTTARDIAVMSRELLRHPLVVEYSKIWMTDLRGGKTQLVNTNKLVRFYSGCTGLKTGTTNGAGSCLSASATRNGLSLVAVTMGSPTSSERFSAARGLLDYGFANYTCVELAPPENLLPMKVTGGVAPQVDVVSEAPSPVIVRTADRDKVEQKTSLYPQVQAPVESGQLLGKVEVLVDGNKVYEYNLVAANIVDEMTFTRAFKKLMGSVIAL